MGLLSRLRGGSRGVKKTLEKACIPQLMEVMDISLPQAQVTFGQLLRQAEKESRELKTADLPENYGHVLLAAETNDEKIRSMLEKKRSEGVRNADILWWWNMHDLERRMMLKVDEQRRTTEYLRYRQAGFSKDEAGEKVRRFYPSYGNPDDLTQQNPEDGHLPPELKRRIDLYIEKRFKADPEGFRAEMEGSFTFNALVRKEIRKGHL
jgi:hypothetical protein